MIILLETLAKLITTNQTFRQPRLPSLVNNGTYKQRCINTDSHERPRYIPRNKSHHVRLHITGSGLKMSGRDFSPVELHRVLAWGPLLRGA